MAEVGFSTGALYKTKLSFEERAKLFHEAECDAIEISFDNFDKLGEFDLSHELKYLLKEYSFISIHAPFIGVKYNSGLETQKAIDKLNIICEQIPVKGIVMHPDLIEDFSIFEKSSLPFLMENMDKRKNDYIHPEHFRKLRDNYSFNFVFDTQHAYEHDSSMKLAEEILDVMKNRLNHMHVAGCNSEERHFPVYKSHNREAIIKILDKKIKVPKILEGVLPEPYFANAYNENIVVRKFEK